MWQRFVMLTSVGRVTLITPDHTRRCAAFNVVLAVLGTSALEDFFIRRAMVWSSCFGAAKESDKITCP
jgi:hypothetical protein